MPREKVYVHKLDGDWVIRIGKRFVTKGGAMRYARTIGKLLAPCELIPVNTDGTYSKRGRETYGADPKRTKG